MDVSAQSAPAPQPQSDAPQSYWCLTEYATLMFWHIALEVLAWVVVLPVSKQTRIRI